MSYVQKDENFQHILRLENTNLIGKRKIAFALTQIKGIGRRFAFLICKNAGVNPNLRAGELNVEQVEAITDVIENTEKYNIPRWFMNRLDDFKTGKSAHLVASSLDNSLREDFERLKKIRCERGFRHAFGLRVRGQHTKTTGRGGRTAGLAKV
eukprot:CAMPEP_0117418436 /NCGR_PEP_ID=MMETSP0758-20121206/214_1 /TAXON_ID=63605 /ORGANISM="Percolomonas cosmopolitus, Strain AE-1 (ATCC 50343)" /LENGTH=152 /DNA_ID=CAMNT_0005198931 /DNA_START=36 /DNA_END=494 /DNA_ORIENTATION=+